MTEDSLGVQESLFGQFAHENPLSTLGNGNIAPLGVVDRSVTPLSNFMGCPSKLVVQILPPASILNKIIEIFLYRFAA